MCNHIEQVVVGVIITFASEKGYSLMAETEGNY